MNQYVSPEVQALARVIFDRFKGQNTIYHAIADAAAKPLLDQLIKEEHITEHHFIEWEGMCEHDQIVVFYYASNAPGEKSKILVVNEDYTFYKDEER